MKRVWNSFVDLVLAFCFVILFLILLALCTVIDSFESQKRKRELRKLSRKVLEEDSYSPLG